MSVRYESLVRGLGSLALVLVAVESVAQTPSLIAGRNVNMVSGITWPNGDPFLQRQNEPSIAVSSRNELHLIAGSNDYRTVDLPGLPQGKTIGDSWISTYFSYDGGGRWTSTLLPGYPQDTSALGLASPLKQALDGEGYEASADPVMRAGTHGLFYYSGIAFTRDAAPPSAGFVATYMDLNNDERGNSIGYVGTTVFDRNDDGSSFIDKPWIAVDKPRAGSRFRTFAVHTDDGPVQQTVECGNVYAAWARIQGDGTLAIESQMMFARSLDCAATFEAPIQLSLPSTINQGAAIAVDPTTGHIHVAWRQFENATLSCTQPAVYWRDNPEAWPVDTLELAGLSFDNEGIDQFFFDLDDLDDLGDLIRELLAWFSSGDLTRNGLFRQLLAAWLNGLSGADTGAVETVMAEAEAWLLAHPPGTRPSRAERRDGVALWLELLYYNWGVTGPGRCDAMGGGGLSGLNPNAIMVVTSTDFGGTFSAPVAVTDDGYFPFEQGTTEFSFRTTGYPTMTVDNEGRAYIAYATRGIADDANPDPVGGDSRIAVTTSLDGVVWTEAQPIDAPAVPGHQLMPALDSARGKVFLVYYDFREDVSGVFDRFIVDLPVDLTTPRHSTDVRAAVAEAADVPVFTDYSVLQPSTQASRYPFFLLEGQNPDPAVALMAYRQQLLYNPPNLPMFKGGTVPFFGDYIDLATSRFVTNELGNWDFDNDPERGAPIVHAVWTDNRDVVGPPDGDWTSYVPPGDTGGQPSLFDPAQIVPVCTPNDPAVVDRTQMRNQNIYTARLTEGLAFAVPANNRPLDATLQRVFVAFAQNLTSADKRFELEILNQPPNGSASFEQFALDTEITGIIEAGSSLSRSIFVTSTDAAASIDVGIVEVDASGMPVEGGLTATARINPDPTAPQPTAENIANEEIYTPAIFNPAIFNPAIFNPTLLGDGEVGIYNPAIFNPAIFNSPEDPEYVIWALTQLSLLNPAIFNPAIFNPAIFNPAIFNPAIFNPAIFNPAIFNPAIFNPAIFNPAIFNPAIFNPAIFNPAIFNTSMVETSVVIENEGNTTAAYGLNLDLDQPPEGFLFQVMVYRTYTVPSADGCALTETVEQEQLVNVLTPDVTGDLDDPDATSFYVAPGDHVVVSVRIVPDPNAAVPGDPSTIDTLDELDLAASVVPQAVDTPGLAAGLLAPTPVIVSSQCDVVVAGTGAEATDVAAMSAAVNGPHTSADVTVCLHGTFDFGATGFVSIDPDHVNAPAETVQELDVVGFEGATIRGGEQAMRFPPTSELPRLAIRDLRFEEPAGTAVSIFRGNERIEISGLEIDGVLSAAVVPGVTVPLREGIAFTTTAAEIAGTIEITSNTIDGGAYDPVGDLVSVNAGIALFGAFSTPAVTNTFPFTATARVAGNTLTSWAGSGIAAIGLTGILIEDNKVAPGTFANQILSGNCATVTGLGGASGISLAGVTDSVVQSNAVEIDSPLDGNGNPQCSVGIILVGDNGAATGDSTGNEVRSNEILGDGNYALLVGTSASAAEENNLYVDNDLGIFVPSDASLFLGPGANMNTFIGTFPSIEGNVVGNSFNP